MSMLEARVVSVVWQHQLRSCYMYRPVRPYILKANDGEKRGLTLPWFISGRAHAVGVANTEYVAKKVKEGLVFFGVVGTRLIAQPAEKCPKCLSQEVENLAFPQNNTSIKEIK